MTPINSHSKGFILPLMLILILTLSLFLAKLYEAEQTHLALYAAVMAAENHDSVLQRSEQPV